jgi:hypothetical protein
VTPEERAIADKREAVRNAEDKAEWDQKHKATPDEGVGGALGCLGAVLMPFIGLFAGAWVGDSLGPQPDPNATADLSGLDWLAYGAIIGFFAGVLVGWTVWSFTRPSD